MEETAVEARDVVSSNLTCPTKYMGQHLLPEMRRIFNEANRKPKKILLSREAYSMFEALLQVPSIPTHDFRLKFLKADVEIKDSLVGMEIELED